MFCRICGEKIPDDSLFCPRCGRDVIPLEAAAPAERSFTPYSAARGQQSGNNNSALSYEQRTDSMNDAYLDL